MSGTGRSETRRTPWPAAGCNKPAGQHAAPQDGEPARRRETEGRVAAGPMARSPAVATPQSSERAGAPVEGRNNWTNPRRGGHPERGDARRRAGQRSQGETLKRWRSPRGRTTERSVRATGRPRGSHEPFAIARFVKAEGDAAKAKRAATDANDPVLALEKP